MVDAMRNAKPVKLRSGPPAFGGIYGMGTISLLLLVAMLVFIP